jgi:FkbM family methyltransferase
MKSLSHYVQRAIILASHLTIPPTRRKVRHVSLPGFDLLVFANEAVGRPLWLFRSYEPEETALFNRVIKPADICVDIGGNVGYFSMLLASRATQGHVHVFEPIPLNAAMINANRELNGFANVTVNNTAVGDSTGKVSFSISGDSSFSSMIATGRMAEAHNVSVPILRLDDHIAAKKLARVDIMKVDVEGAEDKVIDGAKNLLTSTPVRPRLVLLELFDENLKPFGSSVSAIVSKMRSWGYVPNICTASGSLQPFTPEMTDVHPNVIFTPV